MTLPPAGEVTPLGPLIRRIIAPNPGPMTGPGTNSYLIGAGGRLALIDPGPAMPAHQQAILAALGPGETIATIIVTHSHLDHSALARPLAAVTGAEVLAFGPSTKGQTAAMARRVADGLTRGGEGVDSAFRPDRDLPDGAVIPGDGWSLGVLHTPGHMSNHICLSLGPDLFCGDHVMGWSTSLVSPPDGDMGQFMASLARLVPGGWQRMLPGHGDLVTQPAARLAELIAHRRTREAAILALIDRSPVTAGTLLRAIYVETPPALHPAALRNILAHLIDLEEKGRIRAEIGPEREPVYHPIPPR